MDILAETPKTPADTALIVAPDAKDIRLLRCLPFNPTPTQPRPVAVLPMFQREMLMLCAKYGLVAITENDQTYTLTEAGQAVHNTIYHQVEVADGPR